LPDIIDLIKINKYNFKAAEFKDLCLKYGDSKIYNEIREGVNA